MTDSTDQAAEHKQEWARRADALGRAQSRLLWIALVVAVFFFSLQQSQPEGDKADVPILGVDLSRGAVLAAGGPTLAFLVIAICGSLKAWGDAMKKYGGEEWREHAGRLDMYPTAFDLAHYTTMEGTPKLEIVSYFLFYPTFLALILVESGSLVLDLALGPAPGRWLFLVIGTMFFIWASRLVTGVWRDRIADVRTKLRDEREERELLGPST